MLDRKRQNLLMMANVRAVGGAELRVRVRDISKGGLKVDAPVVPNLGEALRIDIPNLGWRDGRGAWAEAGSFGIRLNTEIDPAVVRQPVTGTYARPPIVAERLLRCIA